MLNNDLKLLSIFMLAAALLAGVAATTVIAVYAEPEDEEDEGNGNDNNNGNDNGNGNNNGGESGIIDTKGKQPDKPKVCQVKVQVKVLNAINGTVYTVQVGELPTQAKEAAFNQTEIDEGDNKLAFNFQFKKAGGDSCPEKNSTVLGNVNGLYGFAAYINSVTKVNKIGVELPEQLSKSLNSTSMNSNPNSQ